MNGKTRFNATFYKFYGRDSLSLLEKLKNIIKFFLFNMLSIMINHLNNYIIDNFLFIYKRLENHILIYLNRLLVLMEKLLDILVIQ